MSEVVLGASHLASAGWELQRKNNFEISITGVGDSERLLTLAVVSGALPSEQNSPKTVQYGNSDIKIAGPYTISSGTLVVRDFLQKDVEAMIEEWRSTVFNKRTHAVGFAADYKKQARVVQYAPDGTNARTWKISGVWPSSVDYGTLSQSDSEIKEITITLEYDLAEISRG